MLWMEHLLQPPQPPHLASAQSLPEGRASKPRQHSLSRQKPVLPSGEGLCAGASEGKGGGGPEATEALGEPL